MKKSLIFALALCLLILAGCRATLEDRPVPEEATVDWGITMTAENVTPTGCILLVTQAGCDGIGELDCGVDYLLQGLTEDGWRPVKKIRNYDIASEAYPLNDRTQTFEIDWASQHGKLPAGTYRIGKSVITRNASGKLEKQYFYSEPFTIEK